MNVAALSRPNEGAPIMIDSVPVGIDYYAALQKAWSRAPERPPSLPPLAMVSDVNLNTIEEMLSGDSEGEELRPPVPLGLIITYFIEDWRDSGLYDIVRKREETLSQQPHKWKP
ncbi:hypothetical protein Q4I28_004839 [Leishmania naiffi]|uniref:Uncharacterized protein n=1 Tax=Leishmania naiffi TaxID=5678 RepID=A0AAW3BN28_9TRYP